MSGFSRLEMCCVGLLLCVGANCSLAVAPPSSTPAKSVSVSVKRTTGEPLQGISVLLAFPDNRWVGGGVTNALGSVTVTNVPCPVSEDITVPVRLATSPGTWDELPEADRVLYWRTAIRSPQSCVIAAADESPVISLVFEPARIVSGSVVWTAGVTPTENVDAIVSDRPEIAFVAERGFKIAHVRQQATTLFYGGSKLQAVLIPEGQSDVDTGELVYVPESSTTRISGEIDVEPELLKRYKSGVETEITFIRLTDRAIFRRTIDAAATGRGPDRRRVWPIGDSASTSPSVALPPGEYLVVPGAFRARDYQVRAYERVVAGEKFQPPATVFRVSNDESINIGRINYKEVIDYFLADARVPEHP